MLKPQEIDLKQLGSILSRRRRLILTTAGVCLALAVAVNLMSRPIYVATVSVEVRKEPNRSPLTGEAIASDQWQSDNVAVFTAAELVTNRTLLRDVALKLKERGLLQMSTKPRPPSPGPGRGAPAAGDGSSGDALNREIDWLIGITSVKPVRDTRLFNVEVEHWNPATATSIADMLANTYAASQARWLATADSSRAGEMSQQMEETRKRIKKLESSLNGSSRKAPVILAEQLKQSKDAIDGLSDSYVKVQTDRQAVGAQLDRARAVLRDSLRDPTDLPVQSETLDALWRNLLARQTELARAREVYRDGHPKVMMLVSELRTIRQSIYAELVKIISALAQEHAVLRQRERRLQATIAAQEGKLHQVSGFLAQQTTIQSELQSSREVYDKLSTIVQVDQVSGAVRNPLVRVVGSATVGSKPVRPRRLFNMVLGVMVGLLSGTGLALLQEYLRQTIRTPIDATEQLELPVLGMIPKRTGERFPRMKGSTPQVTRAFEADCYASLGAEVERRIADGKRTLLITSSGPGEGKSTIAAGLAGVLSRLRGINVVLVDTDQYRPSQYRLFNVDNAHGLGELLDDVYQSDPCRADPNQLGFGDWIELLQVQGRSGRLVVAENDQAYVVSLLKGAIVGIVEQKGSEDRLLADELASRGLFTTAQRDIALRLCEESREPLGDIVLRLGYVEPEALHAAQRVQVAERLQRILAMGRPRCEFSGKETDDSASRMRRPRLNPDARGIDAHLQQQMRDFAKRPYLARQIEGYLKETEVGSLKILTSGVAPSNLMTSSGSVPLRCLLENLSRMFDVVIVDSPPVAVTSPAEVIAQMVDGVLLAVMAGGYDVQVIRRTKERLESHDVPLLGMVLNQVDFQHADNNLHYYYSYTHPAAAGDARPPVPLPGSASIG